MEFEGTEESAGGKLHVTWTSAWSTFMLKHLVGVVASGTRTSSGFKSVHYNACAKALNEHFRIRLNGGQISNHHRTWKRKYAKILHIKEKVSGALWDDDNCIIRLEHDSAIEYIQNHKQDTEFINKPIENFREMQNIFGNNLATGKFAKGSNESLGTDVTHIDEDEEANDNEESATGVEFSATKPTKRAKSSVSEEDGLIATLGRVGDRLAMAIEAAGAKSVPPPPPTDEVPENLYETLQNMEGFNETHISHYYAYLVENPRSARAFMKLPYIGQLTWVARYITKEFNH